MDKDVPLCRICGEFNAPLERSAHLRFVTKRGQLEIYSICDECAGKIDDFLRALGWSMTERYLMPAVTSHEGRPGYRRRKVADERRG